MIIYWSMIALTGFLAIMQVKMGKAEIFIRGKHLCKGTALLAFIWTAYIIFWIGLRSGVADAPAYISGFKEIPVGFEHFEFYLSTVDKGVGFGFIAFLFKNMVSQNYHAWLFFITLVSTFCVVRVYYRQSENFFFTAYLFLASCIFTWLFNGIRQFLATVILFAFSDLMVKGKTFKYIVLILLVSLIHNTALVMLPICIFFRKKEPWKWQTFVFVVVFVIGVFYADSLLNLFMQTEAGAKYAEGLALSEGTNILRIGVAAVPCVLAFIERDVVSKEKNEFINLCVNMSFVSLCFYVLSSVTSGVLLGRLPNYFEVYNMILLPWLLKYGFKGSSRKLIQIICVVLYLVFFYYQMTQAWNMYYISDFTGRI